MVQGLRDTRCGAGVEGHYIGVVQGLRDTRCGAGVEGH